MKPKSEIDQNFLGLVVLFVQFVILWTKPNSGFRGFCQFPPEFAISRRKEYYPQHNHFYLSSSLDVLDPEYHTGHCSSPHND